MKTLLLLCLTGLTILSCKKSDADQTVAPQPAPKSAAKDILSFSFSGLDPAVTAEIGASPKTVKATVPYGTSLTELAPTIIVSEKAVVSPASGAVQNFANGLTYTVTAEDGSKQEYRASVSVAAFNGGLYKLFSDFSKQTLAHRSGEKLYQQRADLHSPAGDNVWEFEQPNPLVVTPSGHAIYTIRNKATRAYLTVKDSDNSLTYGYGTSDQGFSSAWTVETAPAPGTVYVRNRKSGLVLIADERGLNVATNFGHARELWKLLK